MALKQATTRLLVKNGGVRSMLFSSKRCFHPSHASFAIFKIQDERDFKMNVIDNPNLVLLDFYATWCGPCKMLTPRLETMVGLKESEKKKVDLAKVDVDLHEEIAARFKVDSVPAVFAMKKGRILDKFVGLKDEDQLDTFVEEALNKSA